ncbi:hypothetical protein RF11_04482 [Thelohanellus kitauei]|uniref:Uncharacterized protein n=1 Tax=Thelohanellus kitauei TaxID=669202 RepID=A0A0C2J5Z4_THEKT|nr:hypothetical protein RF11_04482 [Thelohanellus kitauei]
MINTTLECLIFLIFHFNFKIPIQDVLHKSDVKTRKAFFNEYHVKSPCESDAVAVACEFTLYLITNMETTLGTDCQRMMIRSCNGWKTMAIFFTSIVVSMYFFAYGIKNQKKIVSIKRKVRNAKHRMLIKFPRF